MAENRARSNTNTVVISGTLVRDSELKTVGSGFNILNFSIANNYVQKSGDQYKQEVNYFDVKAFGKRAESLVNFLKKGTGVTLTAEARQERWQDKNSGKTVSKVVFNANEVEITKWADRGTPAGSQQNTNSAAPSEPENTDGFPEDMPF